MTATQKPTAKLSQLTKLTSFEAAQKEAFARSPELRKLWEETEAKRKISLMLIGLRKNAGLTQTALALSAGWDKAYVSRLESAQGGIPDAGTMARYAAACGATAGFVIGVQSDPQHIHVLDAITLHAPAGDRVSNAFERLRDSELALKENG